MTAPQSASRRVFSEVRTGVLYGVACYAWWGLAPIYFRAIRHVPTAEVLAHRILWSLLFLAVLVAWWGKGAEIRQALHDVRARRILVATTLLIAVNWLTFIWAVAHDEVLQASLGYYMNPLINVFLGFVFLRERLRRAQWWSVALAAAGVSYLTVSVGQAPWIALILGWTFGFYGLLRKTVRADPLTGLLVETMFLTPAAVGYLTWLLVTGTGTFAAHSRATDLLLLAAGVVTATPLLWFTHAARRLRLTTVGFLQYLAPSLHLLLAVVYFGESFTPVHRTSFACIWTALALFTLDAWRRSRAALRALAPSAATSTS